MRDGDQALGTLAQGLSAQLRYTVLGHDVVHITTAGRYRTACCDRCYDFGSRVVFGSLIQRDDRPAAHGQIFAAHKVHKSAAN